MARLRACLRPSKSVEPANTYYIVMVKGLDFILNMELCQPYILQ